ncbi:MAG TPA: cytochrome C, partial [Burkholderiaceae bacterium]|nr:cytochrome C [Burkholderiaceae bacterium]
MSWSGRAGSSVLALVPGVAAAQTPSMSYLRTFGPAGDPATHLGWGLGIVSIAVMIIIAVLLLAAVFKRRAIA